MGSGLILLIIVGAWLAVLVPMALRSHDAASALSTVDRFSDAMRVLSRRDPGASGHGRPEDPPLVPAPAPRERTRLTAAARRRRALVVLVLVAVGTLAGGIVVSPWLFVPHAVVDLLLVAFVVWLRSSMVGRAEREWRAAMGDRTAPGRGEPAWSPLREWAPERPTARDRRTAAPGRGSTAEQPGRADVLAPVLPHQGRGEVLFDQEAFDEPASALPVAIRSERTPTAPAPAPARGAQGEPWQPVPVPVPTYVTAARAPRRTIDLTAPRPARQALGDEGLGQAERSLGIDDRGPELEHILGRRAVGG